MIGCEYPNKISGNGKQPESWEDYCFLALSSYTDYKIIIDNYRFKLIQKSGYSSITVYYDLSKKSVVL